MGNAFEIKGHSMHGRFLLGALILFTTGCMHIPLRNNTANQARTVSDLYQQQVLNNLAMFVDDNQLQKKSVNLFEPVWVNLQDQSQPVQLVVNQIGKDQIQGYISAPKYKRSELGETASTGQQPSPATEPAQK